MGAVDGTAVACAVGGSLGTFGKGVTAALDVGGGAALAGGGAAGSEGVTTGPALPLPAPALEKRRAPGADRFRGSADGGGPGARRRNHAPSAPAQSVSAPPARRRLRRRPPCSSAQVASVSPFGRGAGPGSLPNGSASVSAVSRVGDPDRRRRGGEGVGPAPGEGDELAAERGRVGDALLAIPLEALPEDRAQALRHVGANALDGGQVLFADLGEDVAQRLAAEGRLPGEHLVEDDPERPDVGARVHPLGAPHLLR